MTVPARLTATEAQEQARETLGRAIQLAALYTSELRGAKHAEWLRDIHLAALAVLVGAAERTSELENALANAAETFEEMAAALHLLRHPVMAEACEIASDGSRQALAPTALTEDNE